MGAQANLEMAKLEKKWQQKQWLDDVNPSLHRARRSSLKDRERVDYDRDRTIKQNPQKGRKTLPDADNYEYDYGYDDDQGSNMTGSESTAFTLNHIAVADATEHHDQNATFKGEITNGTATSSTSPLRFCTVFWTYFGVFTFLGLAL